MDIDEEIEEQQCDQCEGTGVVTIPNGPDDYTEEFCSSCPEGERLAAGDGWSPLSRLVMGWADEFRAVCEANGFFIDREVI